jgi:hypothetical protein
MMASPAARIFGRTGDLRLQLTHFAQVVEGGGELD